MKTIIFRIVGRFFLGFVLLPLGFGAGIDMPLAFEPNRGQAPGQVRFLVSRSAYSVFLTDRELVLKQHDAAPVTVRLAGARKPRAVQGWEPTGGISNYIFGSDPSKWRSDIPHFARVQYTSVYPGIDLVFHSNQGRLEYDFLVAPGADTKKIQLQIEGASGIALDNEGNLVLQTGSGILRQAKPAVYQDAQGGRVRVDAEFVLSRSRHVGIHVAGYNSRKPLVIDPVISFSATLASSGGSTAVSLDPVGNVYVIDGSTPLGPPGTISVTKLDPTLSTVLYSTYFGPPNSGSGNLSAAAGIAVDSSGSAYITGFTNSASFPTTPGAYQTTRGDTTLHDAFLTKLGPMGAIAYSTYLGGNSEDQASSVAVDAAGSAYIAGFTQSTNFPTTPGAYQQPIPGIFGAFVTKFKPDGSGLVYSTLLRTGFLGTSIGAIALDSNGDAYVGGMGTPSVVIGVGSPNDGWVAKLNPTGTGLVYSKFIGGSGNDGINGIAVDNSGNAYVVGTTNSTDLPTTTGAFQTHYGGGLFDAFAAKLSPDGMTLLYSTYLGGSGDDRAEAIAINNMGNAIIGGSTGSVDFPVANAVQSINPTLYLGNPSTTAYVAKLDATGSHAIFSTYLGGHIGEDVRAIALDQSGNVYATGITGSPDFPVTSGTIQTAIGSSGGDAFLTKITDPTPCTFSTSVSQPSDAGGSIFVTAPPACFWYSAKKDSWVTFGPTTSGFGNGTVTYTLAPNSGPARTATVSVAGQSVNFMQASTCAYQVDQLPGIPGSPGNLFVTTQIACTWTVTSNTSWLSVSPSGVQTGSLGVNLTATTNPGLQPRVGTITFNGIDSHVNQTITVTQSVAPTTMSLQPYALNFGRSNSVATSSQTITVTFDGPAQPSWTASSGQNNIQISPTSGTGNATIQVSVSPGFGGAVTISVPAISEGRTIPVNIFNVANGPPFGNFDTPVDNTTGVAGAIPVTGWALDNIEVSKVDVWREPVGAEPQNALVYIGDATFVAGTRPDLPPKYPNTPWNTRGGWGYMLLTNFLPNNNGGAGGGGNGTYKLHAIAHNKGGTSQDLGTRTITVDNAHASKPFGTIDTPGQGGTVSGNAYVNFGWALTQNASMIPADGSTITVMVDGVPVGHPTYNQPRSDIATLFPGLANSNGAVGFYYIDTTTLANGLHTISWNVFDNRGHGDGIGSRYFNVSNGASAVAAPEQPVQAPAAGSGVLLRRGLDRNATRLEPDDNGVLNLAMQELEHIELELGANDGHLLVNGEDRSLPIGSTLKDGVFYWQPGPGFFGEYELVFRGGGLSELGVKVTIQPKRFR